MTTRLHDLLISHGHCMVSELIFYLSLLGANLQYKSCKNFLPWKLKV